MYEQYFKVYSSDDSDTWMMKILIMMINWLTLIIIFISSDTFLKDDYVKTKRILDVCVVPSLKIYITKPNANQSDA